MKKTVNVAIGSMSFIMDEDAYQALSQYLDKFRQSLQESETNGSGTDEVMDELEVRISDLFKEKLQGREVVNIEIVQNVIKQLGMPDWNLNDDSQPECFDDELPRRRLYRDLDNKKIGGVCSGLSLYLNIDVTLLRVIFVMAAIFGMAGFWIYLIICIIAPVANTAAQKCELRGIPASAENIRKFSMNRKQNS